MRSDTKFNNLSEGAGPLPALEEARWNVAEDGDLFVTLSLFKARDCVPGIFRIKMSRGEAETLANLLNDKVTKKGRRDG